MRLCGILGLIICSYYRKNEKALLLGLQLGPELFQVGRTFLIFSIMGADDQALYYLIQMFGVQVTPFYVISYFIQFQGIEHKFLKQIVKYAVYCALYIKYHEQKKNVIQSSHLKSINLMCQEMCGHSMNKQKSTMKYIELKI